MSDTVESNLHPALSGRRAYRLVSTDGGLRLRKHEEGAPDLGPRDVLVRIEAASLNYRDLLILRRQLGPVRESLVPLSDGAGVVVAIGATRSPTRRSSIRPGPAVPIARPTAPRLSAAATAMACWRT